MGNKSEARNTMMQAGSPGCAGKRKTALADAGTAEDGLAMADEIGFPVMIKAALPAAAERACGFRRQRRGLYWSISRQLS